MGENCWSANAALYHESKTGSPAAAARNDLRKIGMDDAFFMFWLIAKQGVDRAAVSYKLLQTRLAGQQRHS